MYKLALCVYEIYLQASFNTLHIWTYTMYKHVHTSVHVHNVHNFAWEGGGRDDPHAFVERTVE